MKDKLLTFLKKHKIGLIITAVFVIVIFVILPKVIGNKANEMMQGMYQTEKPTVQDTDRNRNDHSERSVYDHTHGAGGDRICSL